MRLDKAKLWTCGVETLLNPSPGYVDGTEFFLSLVRSMAQSNSEKQRWLQWWSILTQNEYNTANPLYSCMGKSASKERFRSQPKHSFKNMASLCLISNNGWAIWKSDSCKGVQVAGSTSVSNDTKSSVCCHRIVLVCNYQMSHLTVVCHYILNFCRKRLFLNYAYY